VLVSYLELYNEVGYDLLGPGREAAGPGLEALPQVGGWGRRSQQLVACPQAVVQGTACRSKGNSGGRSGGVAQAGSWQESAPRQPGRAPLGG
jgi:hypothetical protein